jgi:hypothetical protein
MHYGGFAELAAAVCCALSERNRGNKQHSEAKARFSKRGSTSSSRASTNQLTSLLARARFSSALDKKWARRPKHCTKPPMFGGLGKPNGIMPALSNSQTSKSQSSGASWIVVAARTVE